MAQKEVGGKMEGLPTSPKRLSSQFKTMGKAAEQEMLGRLNFPSVQKMLHA